mmetsp:Transcript_6140/g.9581  ORF Transcript_6140/g.9581 Transcript_6140/m.9581 type:complete len:181 (-) Transcript_6140:34-576(-)|eukprot:CAMPEP_0178845360 /NCGR_PEP_ID=MMETSP0746-20121128/17366_1 /TAXON_ID=913974 /ORGANISM="Nitzschia punctata, Strain CCMP561" /LENGTH=180 /DNA_ID=CAMNT_0020509491 /DNA_START=32 /DNA_END=574 /DNA_ORIENTATION=+
MLFRTTLLLSVAASLLQLTCQANAKTAHFTMEFIPTFKNGLPHKCKPSEVQVMEKFLGDLLSKETGMQEHNVEYLDQLYEADDSHSPMKRHHFQKVRGFDFSMECPADPKAHCGNSDWCHLLCNDDDADRPNGRESLTTMASNLKDKLHAQSKTLEGPFNVKCLGHTEQLDFHLLVSVSP